MTFIKDFFNKYREIILYLLTGGLTTVVSLLAWYLTLKIGINFLADENGQPTELLDVLGSTTQWVVGVLVAFVTNKLWVFTYADSDSRSTAKQLLVFSSSRVLTYFLEVGVNLGAIALFELVGYRAFAVFGFEVTHRLWAKIISSVLVVVSNYFISKLLVFRKKTEEE